MRFHRLAPALLAVAAPWVAAVAQQPAAAPSSMVGQKAPDFTLPAAARGAVLAKPFRLSDHLGETVVLAFFSQARTKG